jgi:hypothetical protein
MAMTVRIFQQLRAPRADRAGEHAPNFMMGRFCADNNIPGRLGAPVEKRGALLSLPRYARSVLLQPLRRPQAVAPDGFVLHLSKIQLIIGQISVPASGCWRRTRPLQNISSADFFTPEGLQDIAYTFATKTASSDRSIEQASSKTSKKNGNTRRLEEVRNSLYRAVIIATVGRTRSPIKPQAVLSEFIKQAKQIPVTKCKAWQR